MNEFSVNRGATGAHFASWSSISVVENEYHTHPLLGTGRKWNINTE